MHVKNVQLVEYGSLQFSDGPFFLPYALIIFCFILGGTFPRMIGTSKLPYEVFGIPSVARLRICFSAVS